MQNPDNKASLGCGTLILIALIVMIFGNANRGGDTQLNSKIRDLQSDVSNLKSAIKKQSATLNEIKESLDKINKRATPSRPRVVVPRTPEAPLPEN